MKSRVLVCAMLLVLFAVPALADSISFTNSGTLSGDLNSGVVSTANDFTVDGFLVGGGPFATLAVNLGTFTGTLMNGGSFTNGNFELDSNGSALFATVFSGTWSKIGNGLYDLVGIFSGTTDGISYNGLTTQTFTLAFNNGHICLLDLNGSTTINVATVPEPGTVGLLGTGLVGLAGVLRRKMRTRPGRR